MSAGLLVRAETRKLLSRTAARLGLVVSAVIGLLVPLVLVSVSDEWVINATSMRELVPYHAPGGLQWTLEARNLYILRMLLLVLAASSFAGELKAGTLKEDLLRPVARPAVLLAKWLALSIYAAMTLLVTLGVASITSVIAFGAEGPWSVPLVGFGATWLTDVGFVGVALAISVYVRSVPLSIGATFLLLILGDMTGLGMWGLYSLAETLPNAQQHGLLTAAHASYPWLPSTALAAWKGYRPTEPWPFSGLEGVWHWESFATLGLMTGLSLLLAAWIFKRTDIS